MANEKIIAQKEQEVNELAAKIKDAKIHDSILGSDHAPVELEIEI